MDFVKDGFVDGRREGEFEEVDKNLVNGFFASFHRIFGFFFRDDSGIIVPFSLFCGGHKSSSMVNLNEKSILKKRQSGGGETLNHQPNIFTKSIKIDGGGDSVGANPFREVFEVSLEDVARMEKEIAMIGETTREDTLNEGVREVFVVDKTANEGAHQEGTGVFFGEEVGGLVNSEEGTNNGGLDGWLGGSEVGEGDTEEEDEVFVEPGDEFVFGGGDDFFVDLGVFDGFEGGEDLFFGVGGVVVGEGTC